MPYKPKNPCKWPGCKNLTNGRYCTEHLKVVRDQYNAQRTQEEKARYTSDEWQRAREEHLIEFPYCQICRKYGHLVRATEVHHIRPLADGGTHDRGNLISLCHRCHFKIHAERGELFGKGKVYGYSESNENGSD